MVFVAISLVMMVVVVQIEDPETLRESTILWWLYCHWWWYCCCGCIGGSGAFISARGIGGIGGGIFGGSPN